ncbi:MAG: hypothetical protein DDT22_00193 [candidate division WS2 bacterium]|nr:hypothetical protein [Candidatus Lithacetigena glycinireducens]
MDLVSRKKTWLLISGIVITLSALFLFAGWRITGSPLNLGIDFTGGSIVEISLTSDISESQVREIIQGLKIGNVIVQSIPGDTAQEKHFLIRTPVLTQEKVVELENGIKDSFKEVTILRSEMVGPTIGAMLRRQAVAALILALVFIMFYITWRFDFPFAVATILALMHDVIVTVGALALFRFEINSPFVAVILTLVGYSVMDSVVVLDRVRENRKLHSGTAFSKIVNMSILQSFRRSINTSVTTILAVLAIFIFGPIAVKPFSFGLGVGLITGTYSSLFIASMLLVIWQEWREKRFRTYARKVNESRKTRPTKRKT